MDTQSSTKTPFGTAKQAGLIRQLAGTLGFDDVEAALAEIGAKSPLTVQEASAAIDKLKAKAGGAEQGEPQGGERGGATAGSAKSLDATRPRYLTARHLLLIHSGAMPMPENIDADAAEVLQRLARLSDVERAVGSLPAWSGMNNGGPIEVAHVVDYFGSIAVAAAAFGVSADTFRSWGTYVPEKRTFEAEVRTRGRVCAPRR